MRTSELLPLRGCVLEESIPALKSEKIKSMPTKDVLEFVCPELNLSRYEKSRNPDVMVHCVASAQSQSFVNHFEMFSGRWSDTATGTIVTKHWIRKLHKTTEQMLRSVKLIIQNNKSEAQLFSLPLSLVIFE